VNHPPKRRPRPTSFTHAAFTPTAFKHAAFMLAAGTLAGCTLIDQNTFYPGAKDAPAIAEAPKPAVETPKPPGPPPLVTISPGARPADYAVILGKAARDARARKPDVMFDVVEMEKPDAPPDTIMGAGAADVARELVANGVAPARIRLVARPDASAVAKEVRVYVR
jgi:hypothetical protein